MRIFFISIFQIGGQIISERNIAIGPLAEVMTVDPNLALTIYAVKIDENIFVLLMKPAA